MSKDLSAALALIETFPVDDRISLISTAWDRIAADPAAFEIPASHKRELERRLADADVNPDDVLDREEVMTWLRNQP